ncbi:hypothetical protein BaRGS_00021913 [Batillaria attramentaria]|uniref:Uncharacterized protein n=1 Tax=Batillaria attramentaria TaxID=370345 RepID=A0ABD0KI45_9CAEN
MASIVWVTVTAQADWTLTTISAPDRPVNTKRIQVNISRRRVKTDESGIRGESEEVHIMKFACFFLYPARALSTSPCCLNAAGSVNKLVHCITHSTLLILVTLSVTVGAESENVLITE